MVQILHKSSALSKAQLLSFETNIKGFIEYVSKPGLIKEITEQIEEKFRVHENGDRIIIKGVGRANKKIEVVINGSKPEENARLLQGYLYNLAITALGYQIVQPDVVRQWETVLDTLNLE